jgi:hypothetical protein
VYATAAEQFSHRSAGSREKSRSAGDRPESALHAVERPSVEQRRQIDELRARSPGGHRAFDATFDAALGK